jgi:hypothetical protein
MLHTFLFQQIDFLKEGILNTRRMTRCQAFIRCHLIFADFNALSSHL